MKKFSYCLEQVHPYFISKINNLGNKHPVSPSEILFLYQCIQSHIRMENTNNPYASKEFINNRAGNMVSIVRLFAESMGMIFEEPTDMPVMKDSEYVSNIVWSNVEPIISYLFDISLYHSIGESIRNDIKTHYGTKPICKGEPLEHELIIIKEALDSFKRLLNILSEKKHFKNTISYSVFMRLYRLGFDEDTILNIKNELDGCEHPFFSTKCDSMVQNIKHYENYDYSKLDKSLRTYGFYSFEQLVYFYASYLYNHNEIIIRKCDNCGKFFIAEDRREKYCRNILKDTNGKTCRDVGAINKRNKKYG